MDLELELVKKFAELSEKKNKAEAELEEISKQYDDTEDELMELLEDQNKVKSSVYQHFGHVTIVKPRLYASTLEDRKDELLEYIREQGREDLIKVTVPPGSLSTFVSEELKEKGIVPPGANYYLKSKLRHYPQKPKK